MKKRIISILILVVIFAVIIFFTSPNLNPIYGEGLAFWAFAIIVFSAIFLFQSAGKKGIVYQDNGAIKYTVPKKGRRYIIIAAVPWVILILLAIYSSVLFHVQA